MDDCSRLWDDLKTSVSMHSVGGKAAPVQCEHPLGFKLLRQNSQSCVCEIHWDVFVPFHQGRDSLKTFRRRGDQLKGASEDELETSFLRAPARSDQAKCFGQYRFCGDDGADPSFQRGDAVIVQLLVTVHERHKGSGIQQELSGHGATDGSSNRGGADPSRAGRWQRCREDRVRVRWVALPAGCPDIVPKPRVLLPIACVLAVWLSALIWSQDPLAIALLIDVPYGVSLVLHCNAMRCKCPTQLDELRRRSATILPNVLARADKVIK
jgi:hypothetical protein